MSSSERFGYEWNKYSDIDSNYEKQFKNWTHPLESDFFKDKVILDAGCGMGRNSLWPLKWKAKEVEELFGKLGLGSLDIHQPPNKSGWIIIGKK